MIDLQTERMAGYGAYEVNGMQVNYLYGLKDLCEMFLGVISENIPSVLELGTNNGVSTLLLSEYANVTTIDILDCVSAKDRCKESKHKVHFINSSFEFYFNSLTDESPLYDLVYIDGSHTYEAVKSDIHNSLKCLKPNGVIAGHDYNPITEGVIFAVNEFSKTIDASIRVFSDSSWAIRLKPC